MAAEVSITFKVTEEMAREVGQTAFEMDITKSEFLRACITYAIDALRNNPSMAYHIRFEDRKSIR